MDAGLGDYPLVLHGASSVPQYLVDEINKYGGKMPDAQGVPEADIEVARRMGCTKVNIDTDLRIAMTAGIRKVFAENPKEFDPRKYLGPRAPGGQRPRPPQSERRPLLRRSRVRLNRDFKSRPKLETAWGFLFSKVHFTPMLRHFVFLYPTICCYVRHNCTYPSKHSTP